MSKKLFAFLLTACGGAWAQFGTGGTTFDVRHTGDYSDQRRDGRCVIRVWVDDEVDVELRWDKIRMQSVRGRVGRDDGSECNAPLQQGGISNFQFRGIDGRGQVTLREQPNAQNGWASIVRISDSRRGEGAYTFELTWDWNGQTYNQQSGNWGQPNFNPTSACRNAFRQRLRQDNQGRLTGWVNTASRTWQEGSRAMYEGAANVRTNSGAQEQINFSCAVNANNRTVESIDYRFPGQDFFGKDNNWTSSNVLSLCQQQLRDRFRLDFNTRTVTFQGTPDRWVDGAVERIMGDGYLNSGGRRISFGYSCAGDPRTNNLDWSDYQTSQFR